MNYYRLSNDLTDLVIEALQHFDHIDHKGTPQTFEEATESISGGFKRYQNDPVFRAKVQMLVSRIMATVQEHDLPNAPHEWRGAGLPAERPFDAVVMPLAADEK